MSTTETQEKVEYKTCRVTVVADGVSDRVIKIYPAEHDAEKVFLNNAPGMERWEAIERLMNGWAQRGTRVPKPVPYHSDAKDLSTVTLREQDIPVVTLDGAVFKPLPEDKKKEPEAQVAHVVEKSELDSMRERVARLEALLTAKEKASEETVFSCEKCDFTAKTQKAVAMHAGRFHKENK